MAKHRKVTIFLMFEDPKKLQYQNVKFSERENCKQAVLDALTDLMERDDIKLVTIQKGWYEDGEDIKPVFYDLQGRPIDDKTA